MYIGENAFIVEKELEVLRERLNICAVKILENRNPKEYEALLDISTKLDDIIVNYIKSPINNF